MKNGFWLTLIGILCFVNGKTQDTIVYFDRPGIGDGPYITQKGKINLESGWAYSTYFNSQFSYFPSTLVRFQLAPSNELRMMYDYAPKSLNFLRDANGHDFTYLSIGSKQRLGRTPNTFADIALMGNVFYPLRLIGDFNSQNVCFDAYLVFEHNAPSGSYINYSIGYIYGGHLLKDILQWSFAGNLYVGKFLVFAEAFGYIHLNHLEPEFGFDAGIIYEFNGNMQVDFSAIYNKYGRFDQALFYALGYSVCIGR